VAGLCGRQHMGDCSGCPPGGSWLCTGPGAGGGGAALCVLKGGVCRGGGGEGGVASERLKWGMSVGADA
jgi:hypothetical protein